MQKLFSEFKPNTAAEWKAQLIKDLKGETYESLVWHNENGIEIKPLYTSEDVKQDYEPVFTHTDWEICVTAKAASSKEINASLLKQLNAGATAISVNCSGLDLAQALDGIQLNYIQSTFFVDEKSATDLKEYLAKHYDLTALTCSLFPVQMLSSEDLKHWVNVIALFKSFKGIKTISANALPFHNQDCLAYYEVAIILSQLTEYLETVKDLPLSALVVKCGVNADYFVQMAKLRAIRRLWLLLKKEYAIENDLYLVVETSLTNKSISDNYNNLLRSTVEAMAAVSGGCNELIVNDFDILFPVNHTLAARMSVNQQLILKEESYLNKMADVACGSFYIETITDGIAAKALETFKRFEKEGGYFTCLEKGIISNEITAQAKQHQQLVSDKKQVAIGVNKFKNEKENIELTASQIAALKQSGFNNPVLNFEMEHYFDLKNA